jgi:hypothetical protein
MRRPHLSPRWNTGVKLGVGGKCMVGVMMMPSLRYDAVRRVGGNSSSNIYHTIHSRGGGGHARNSTRVRDAAGRAHTASTSPSRRA